MDKFKSFKEFYPYYLSEHSNPKTKLLHFIGTAISLYLFIYALGSQTYWLIPIGVIQGYAWAWVSHFFIEKNRPATFTYPRWSFMGDFMMFYEIILGKHRIF